MGTVALALPCAPRHSDILSIVTALLYPYLQYLVHKVIRQSFQHPPVATPKLSF